MHPDIEKLIEMASNGEAVTDRQREIIRKKAISLREDPDEAELLLDLSLKKNNKGTSTDKRNINIQNNVNHLPKHTKTEDGKKIIYGVCDKLAKHFNIDVRIIRLITLVLEIVLIFLFFAISISIWWALLIPLVYYIMGKVSPVAH